MNMANVRAAVEQMDREIAALAAPSSELQTDGRRGGDSRTARAAPELETRESPRG